MGYLYFCIFEMYPSVFLILFILCVFDPKILAGILIGFYISNQHDIRPYMEQLRNDELLNKLYHKLNEKLNDFLQ